MKRSKNFSPWVLEVAKKGRYEFKEQVEDTEHTKFDEDSHFVFSLSQLPCLSNANKTW